MDLKTLEESHMKSVVLYRTDSMKFRELKKFIDVSLDAGVDGFWKKELSKRAKIMHARRQEALSYYMLFKNWRALLGGSVHTNEAQVIKHPLSISNNFKEVDSIFNMHDVLSQLDSREFYKARKTNKFEGTYEIRLPAETGYTQFLKVLVDDAISNSFSIGYSLTPSEWLSGYKVDGKRKIRLNSFLRRKGHSQYVLDYYSLSSKDDKSRKVYVTISATPQHIAGMSFYSSGDWLTYSGTSCLDPRNGYDEATQLVGALADDSLFVAMLHEKKDISNLKGAMKARTVCRLIDYNEKVCCIGSKLYGSKENKSLLQKCLVALNRYGVFPYNQVKGEDSLKIQASGRAVFTFERNPETIEDSQNETCFRCRGERFLFLDNGEGIQDKVPCISCNDSNVIERTVTPLAEHYVHYGNTIELKINENILK
ncbi:hypothetical protein ACQKEX_15150 [Bacillus pumilus]|uniref:hypothetical protein n=1 Tax=Bacillus TaxID=1386 RepID=UPI00095AF584|nr:hypothetical protein [Bacillus pumilus]MBU8576465.1 hypothetical protein [Bacillus pumilus]OLP64335.1 hypothetical protein BACPU_25600 [Bacillus pumilus]